VGKNRQKQSEGVRFVIQHSKIQRHVVKNTLLQTAFSVVLPTRIEENFLLINKRFHSQKSHFFEKWMQNIPRI